TSIPFTELGNILKEHERKIKASDEARQVGIATANYTASSERPNHGRRDGPGSSSGSQRGRNQYGGSGSQTRSFSRQQGGCQYCSIPGHTIKECRKLAKFLRFHGFVSQPAVHNT
ncbi:unnamed protein product, partial [Cuscuta campestris]